MSDEDLHDDAYRELQREYLDELPNALAELRNGIEALRRGEAAAAPLLKTGFHRLAGSGGSYGFPEISRIARAAEQLLVTNPAAETAADLEVSVQRLDATLTLARARLAPGSAHDGTLPESS
jgi:HPt (histidine-containing phosphotransfer) domain-containing protein